MPDPEIATAYQRAAVQNVLAAVNPKVFPGYWSVCADSQGFGYGNTYHPDGKGGVIPAGPDKYCEYPANLIRIVQRFLFGVDLQLDGALVLRPTATAEFWERGFGQTVVAGNRKLSYRMQRGRTEGTYHGTAPLRLGLRFPPDMVPIPDGVLINGRPVEMVREQPTFSFLFSFQNLTALPFPSQFAFSPCPGYNKFDKQFL